MREQTTIGGYRLIKRIGSGGMSTVFEAEDGAGVRVALKLLHPALVVDHSGRERLRREVAMLQKVRGRCREPPARIPTYARDDAKSMQYFSPPLASAENP